MYQGSNLLLGNDGVIFAELQRGRMWQHLYARRDDPDALEAVRQAVCASRSRSLHVFVDLVEQVYRHENLPAVHALDRSKLVARRLKLLFPETNLRGALRLKGGGLPETGAVASSGRRRNHYLFTALPDSEEWLFWQGFLASLDKPVLRLTLLPLETVDLVAQLARMAGLHEEGSAEWTLFISRQKTGGFRQIITHKGQLALTRLTPDFRQTQLTECAQDMAEDIAASIGYIRRLGYRPEEGLDVVTLGDEALQAALEAQKIDCRRLVVLPLEQIAQQHRLGRVLPEEEGVSPVYGDLLLLAHAARRRRARLNLQQPIVLRARHEKQINRALWWSQMVASLLIAAYIGWQFYQSSQIQEQIEDVQSQIIQLSQQKEAEDRERGDLPASPALIRSVFAAEEHYSQQSAPVEPVLARIMPVLLNGLRWDTIFWREGIPQEPRRAYGVTETPPRQFELKLTLRLDAYDDPESARQATEALRQKLAASFPSARAEISRLPLDANPGQSFSDTSGTGEQGRWARDRSAEITLSGLSAERPGMPLLKREGE